jgi:hypothetical protein
MERFWKIRDAVLVPLNVMYESAFWKVWMVALAVALLAWLVPPSAQASSPSFEERQARALEEIARTLNEMKRCR